MNAEVERLILRHWQALDLGALQALVGVLLAARRLRSCALGDGERTRLRRVLDEALVAVEPRERT